MKRFQSRIESLRKVRQQAEQLAKLEAAVCQGEQAKADRQVESLYQQLASIQGRSVQETGGNTSAAMLQSLANASLLAESELNHARDIQQQAAKAVIQAVAVVAHAKTQLNIVDDFRERELITYQKEQRSQEENTRQDTNNRRRQRSMRQNNGVGATRQTPYRADDITTEQLPN
ncbi:MAG: hypothetical protein GY758_02920 [Fuerstiella sp.]|jgi:hypothetical protein|nr:hypothetical protein [Fuerstiella sp.]MCP4509377.1 hypothetical protein [Fuerstiella sp.]MDG2128030.1 hypothetical protein [Fuerstiella sp.]